MSETLLFFLIFAAIQSVSTLIIAAALSRHASALSSIAQSLRQLDSKAHGAYQRMVGSSTAGSQLKRIADAIERAERADQQ